MTQKSFSFSAVSEASPEALKSKKNELRLYCDLLMQQVHLVKTAASQEDGPDVEVDYLFYYFVIYQICMKPLCQ